MSHCMSNKTAYKYPMNNFGEMYGDQSYNNYSNRWNCEAKPHYSFQKPEYDGLRHLGIKNYALTRTMNGQQVYKPLDDRDGGCDCGLENCSRNSYKPEGRKGRFGRPCDCHKRDAKQERQERWRCCGTQTPRSATTRAQYDGHPHRRPASPQHQQCGCGGH